MYKNSRTLIGIFFILMIALLGCKKASIVTYHIPKNTSFLVQSESTLSLPFGFETPSHWHQQPPTRMRIMGFFVQEYPPNEIDISITTLTGDAGGLLANVNRWRNQIQLPPISQKELRVETKTISDHQMNIVDVKGPQKRVLVGMYRLHDQQFFFKMMGKNPIVAQEEKVFYQFLNSITLDHEH
ncbi:MAG: hypothetical protein HRT90_08230 [Candidatus Margulisbacteria bacterium]|nr:hypothetical protein [Candidatus Margulisiibacteriota bacterium]